MKKMLSTIIALVMIFSLAACSHSKNTEETSDGKAARAVQGQAPRIISTFLESYDFSGKTILPFCTSHSSGIGSSADNLHSLCADSVIWLEGKRFGSGTTKSEIESWLEGK